ncbi:MAG: hypothetical protein JO076_05260 [Verrucomicrobia bacterium]|nr:hypothetical protein [Verrucomicrobiota bacterium]
MTARKDLVYPIARRLRRRLSHSTSCRIACLLLAVLGIEWVLTNEKVLAQQSVGKTAPGLTSNLEAIPPEQRGRYTQLTDSLRHAIQQKRELPDGYAVRLDTSLFPIEQALEWIKLEQMCCPFLDAQVRWQIENGPVWLEMKGPIGVKDFILDEFALR